MKDTTTLYELNTFIKQVMVLNLPDALWVSAEIAQINFSRGNYYLELIERDRETGEIIAQTEAAIWYRTYKYLKEALSPDLDNLLSQGKKVLVKAKVEFHKRYGLKLIILDIDKSFTIGSLELARQETIERLEKEFLTTLNKTQFLPLVLQRIAVISSETAAGYVDFVKQLNHNPHGYAYTLDLFPAAMQGEKTTPEIQQQLKTIRAHKDRYDCVVIVRGGGSKMDLSAFDSYEIAKAVAKMPLPVIVGIGHEIDTTVLDIVAHTSLKTPTAVAEFLINRNMTFESAVLNLGMELRNEALNLLKDRELSLENALQSLSASGQHKIAAAGERINFAKKELITAIKHTLLHQHQALTNTASIIEQLDPKKILDRGYSLTTVNGKTVTNPGQLRKGEIISTLLKEGKIKSKYL